MYCLFSLGIVTHDTICICAALCKPGTAHMLQMRHAFAYGKVFLRRWKIVPTCGTYAPFHPCGNLVAGQPRPASHDRGQLLNTALMVIYELLGARGKGNAPSSPVRRQSRFYR